MPVTEAEDIKTSVTCVSNSSTGQDCNVEVKLTFDNKRRVRTEFTSVMLCPDTEEMELTTPSNEPDLPVPIPPEERLIDQNKEDNMSEPILLMETSSFSSDSTDPAFYANKKLSAELINEALKLESQNLNMINFPTTFGRKFNPKVKKNSFA